MAESRSIIEGRQRRQAPGVAAKGQAALGGDENARRPIEVLVQPVPRHGDDPGQRVRPFLEADAIRPVVEPVRVTPVDSPPRNTTILRMLTL